LKNKFFSDNHPPFIVARKGGAFIKGKDFGKRLPLEGRKIPFLHLKIGFYNGKKVAGDINHKKV
jgi:hypothetical protein